MSTIKQAVTNRVSHTITNLGTLASATYIASDSPVNCNTNQPLDSIVEVAVTPGTAPTGNKQIVVFIQESLDGTTFRTGPTSGTATTDEPNLKFLGTVPVSTISVLERASFSVASVLGFVPYAYKIVIKNDCGVALSAGTVFTSEITNTVV